MLEMLQHNDKAGPPNGIQIVLIDYCRVPNPRLPVSGRCVTDSSAILISAGLVIFQGCKLKY